MRTRFEPMRPWTRAHEKFARAWGELQQVCARRGITLRDLASWLEVRVGVDRIRELTPAQARWASRQVNAWRGSMLGLYDWSRAREYPRQYGRNRRRARAFSAGDRREFQAAWEKSAGNTADAHASNFQNLIAGTALEALGRVMPSECDR